MNLGLFLSPGDSVEKHKQSGQLDRFLKYYLEPYSKFFNHIYLFTYGDSDKHYLLPSQLKLIPKPKIIPNYLYQLILVFIHWKIIKTIDINRVFQAPGGIPALIAKIIFNKPYVVTYGYDYVFFAKKSGRFGLAFLLSLMIPVVLKLAQKIIVTTPANLQLENTVLIPNGVNPRQFKPQGRRRPDLILAVGRLEPQKNYPLLIEAVSRCRPGIKLVIVGQGSLRNTLLHQAKKLGVDLVILNNLPHSRLINWYQRCSIYTLTSGYEGHPKTLLEAMSCACPVITTSFSGNLITNLVNGLICRHRQALTAAIDKLREDSVLAHNLGLQARQSVLHQYDIKTLVNKEVKLLSS